MAQYQTNGKSPTTNKVIIFCRNNHLFHRIGFVPSNKDTKIIRRYVLLFVYFVMLDLSLKTKIIYTSDKRRSNYSNLDYETISFNNESYIKYIINNDKHCN